MLDAQALKDITDIIEGAHENARPIAKITDKYAQFSIANGYQVQDELLRRWQDQGREFFGYKAGLTSRAKMAEMGANAPCFGRIMRDSCDPEGSFIPTQGLIHPSVEAGIAFVFKDDLAGPNLSIDRIYAATDYVQATLEIIDSRFADTNADLPSLVADHCSAARVVLGGRVRRPEELDLTALGVVLDINGEAKDFAASGAVLGHPAHVVQHLVSWLHSRGEVLKAGTVVLTGAMTAAHAVRAGYSVCARFQDLGTISMRVS